MIVRTDMLPKAFDALTVWPFIFIRPSHAADEALLIHERTHYAEQRAAWVLPWLIRYALSKRFRFQAEVRGYRAQIAAGGITVPEAAFLLMLYGTGCTVREATQLLTKQSHGL